MKIAYFGSEASNTHIVALQTFENEELISKATILDCFKAVENGEIDKAVVPLENSIEGTVSTTLDFLYEFDGIRIEAEVVMPITHHLMIHPENTEIEKIYSHPQALAQCYHF
jgi:prephenate dehydratase